MGTRTLRKRIAEGIASQNAPLKKKRQISKVAALDDDPIPTAKRAAKRQTEEVVNGSSHATNSAKAIKKEDDEDLKETALQPGADEKSASATPRTLRPRRSVLKSPYVDAEDSDQSEKKPTESSTKNSSTAKKEVKAENGEDSGDAVTDKNSRKTGKKTKANPYGLTPGITPFPEWPAPSKDDCEEVYNLLAKVHGEAKAPEKIPAPSLEVSGCGEVPSVLDAMIRTRLSANTSSKNSSAAFKGLVGKFGIVQEGIGQGSVDWNKVRLAPLGDIVEAIKTGGLAQIKSKDIKTILQMVYEENQQRRDAFLAEKETGRSAAVTGALEKTQGQKDLEILKTEQNVLSLDHIHGTHPEEAMQALIKYPGIGVKTASCVILFCLQQPSFAVDTHVHRISRWLKWIPPKATRDEAFSHLEVRIPNHLKYGLHKLFVQHGRTCIRCRANTSKGTDGWYDADCPLESVIDRVGKRQSSGKSF